MLVNKYDNETNAKLYEKFQIEIDAIRKKGDYFIYEEYIEELKIFAEKAKILNQFVSSKGGSHD